MVKAVPPDGTAVTSKPCAFKVSCRDEFESPFVVIFVYSWLIQLLTLSYVHSYFMHVLAS